MEIKKTLIITGIISLMFFILVLNINLVIPQEEFPAFNVCCEKTKSGAWCQNTKEDQCDTSFRKTPTSCDATSYCKLGICVDSAEGLCMDNTPQKVCEISKGTWIDDEKEEIPQCNLGCCIIGNQASFVTQTRCKRLSSVYGLETNFRTDILDEASCILTAYSTDIGACVIETDSGRTCKMTTRGDCTSGTGNSTSGTGTDFFEDFLCSSDELATECGPTKETICVEGREEVYFKDSCGNYANIYDANKIYSNDPSYWQKIVSKNQSCSSNSKTGNAGSASCGNCNYLSGSICKGGKATFGDLACKDLNCYDTQNGKDFKNGESWCIYQSDVGEGQDTVGSRHFRHVCIQGEETIEACADFRNEVCIEERLGTTNGNFIEAACRINRWTDCIDQLDQEDCENIDRRDCYWVEGVYYDGSGSRSSKDQNIDGAGTPIVNENLASDTTSGKENFGILNSRGTNKKDDGFFSGLFGGDDEDSGEIVRSGICLPNSPPGLEFWQEGNAGSICSLGNSRQTVHYEEGFFGSKECVENCDVLTGEWVTGLNRVCTSMGDCGSFSNIAGRETDDGILVKDNGRIRKISQGVAESAATEEDEGLFGGLFG